MTRKASTSQFIRGAQRCAPYNDGHWCFVYDSQHLLALKESGAHELLLGVATGHGAEERHARIADEGLAIAWELDHDGEIRVDVVIGKKLSSSQKARARWLEPQLGYLDIPSGRLRIETLNSLAFGDPPTDAGCEIEVPAGSYDVVLHRLDWRLMDEEPGDRPEMPTEVLTLNPVKLKGPREKNACLLMADALGSDRAWLREGTIEDSTFHGRTRKREWDESVYVNMRGAHLEELGVRFGMSIRIGAGGARHVVPYLGFLSVRGLPTYFGHDWFAEHLGDAVRRSGMDLMDGSPPWLLAVTGIGLGDDVPVAVSCADPWCEIPDDSQNAYRVEDRRVVGRVVRASSNAIIVNVGWKQLHRAGFEFNDVLELSWSDGRRTVYLGSAPSDFLNTEREAILNSARPDRVALKDELAAAWPRLNAANAAVLEAETAGRDTTVVKAERDELAVEIRKLKEKVEAALPDRSELQTVPLLAEGMTHWDRPDEELLWLRAFVGDACFFSAAPGTEVVLTAKAR